MYTLNADQARQLDRFQTTENLCNKNSDKYAILKPFQKQVRLLSVNNKKINSYIPARSGNGEGATEEKRDRKADIATSVNGICSLVIPYALDIEDSELYNAVNFTTTDVIDLRDVAVLGFVTTLVGVITPLLSNPDFADYPVTVEELNALTENANTFNDSLGDNKMIDKDSSIASKNIDTLLAANRLIIAKLNKLINYFETKDPDFVESYRKAAALNNTGIHHSGIRGIIINSSTEQPIESVTIILTGKTNIKNTATDSSGAWQIIKFIPGKCSLTISAPGYQSRTIEVTIIRSKIIELNIALQSQAINMATA